MANTIIHKKSSVNGKSPLTTDLALGELAVNTYNGIIYLKKNDGIESIVPIKEITKANVESVLTGTIISHEHTKLKSYVAAPTGTGTQNNWYEVATFTVGAQYNNFNYRFFIIGRGNSTFNHELYLRGEYGVSSWTSYDMKMYGVTGHVDGIIWKLNFDNANKTAKLYIKRSGTDWDEVDITEMSSYVSGCTVSYGVVNVGTTEPTGDIEVLLSSTEFVRLYSDNYKPMSDKLTTARTISLTGDVTGSTSFDGSANVSITATVADDSHNHIISNVDGLQTALDGKLNLTGGTLTGVLDFNGTTGRVITITGDTTLDSADASIFLGNDPAGYGWDILYEGSGLGNENAFTIKSTNGGNPKIGLRITQDGIVNLPQTGATVNGNTIWHAGNDGSGSGLDADTLDTLHSSSFFRADTSNAVDVRLTSGDGRGLRFWDSDSYKIWMSSSGNATYGGRITGETTSDYNIYFRITNGTNRGFVFENAYATKLFAINGDGVRSQVGIKSNTFRDTIQTLGSISTNTTLNTDNGNVITATIGAALEFTFSGTLTGNGITFMLKLTNGGAYTVTWPSSVKWPGGTAPALTASGTDILVFNTSDGGTTWHGIANLDVK